IFYLSSVPLKIPETIEKIDPTMFILHLIEYSVLGFLFYKAKRNVLFSFIICSSYGVINEIYQIFIPNKFFSFSDIIANSIGSLIGILVFKFLFK
ncbi:MAG: VanZ family protein, partial [Candidatus Aenigmatarchaeota archaeon]